MYYLRLFLLSPAWYNPACGIILKRNFFWSAIKHAYARFTFMLEVMPKMTLWVHCLYASIVLSRWIACCAFASLLGSCPLPNVAWKLKNGWLRKCTTRGGEIGPSKPRNQIKWHQNNYLLILYLTFSVAHHVVEIWSTTYGPRPIFGSTQYTV